MSSALFGAHPIALEKRGMGGLGPDEIIASVVRRSDNHIVRGEALERASKTDAGRCGLSLLKAMTRCWPSVAKCANTEVSPAARPSPFCATRCTPSPARYASSSTSEAGHMMATSTVANERASAMVSSKKAAIELGDGRQRKALGSSGS